MIDAAIIGLGRWGQGFCEAVQNGQSQKIRFVRGVDHSADQTKALGDKHGFTPVASFEAALADPAVQAIVLATPHSQHRVQVEACARAGKAVFCEKPLALTLADAKAMVAACQAAKVTFAVGHNRRFWPSFTALREIVASGELGRLLHIEGHNSNENSNAVTGGWRLKPDESPAGGMTGAGLHILDAFVSLVGPVRRVTTQLIEHEAGPPPIDSLSITLEFANRLSGQMATIRALPLFFRVHVFGVKGSAELRGETEVTVRIGSTAPRVLTFTPVNSQRAELEAFADALDGRAPYPISFDSMLATVAAFEGVVKSVERGAPIAV